MADLDLVACGECGQPVLPNEAHSFTACIAHLKDRLAKVAPLSTDVAAAIANIERYLGDEWASVSIVKTALTAATDRVAVLEGALKRYGEHAPICAFTDFDPLHPPTCTCGFSAALAQDGAQ